MAGEVTGSRKGDGPDKREGDSVDNREDVSLGNREDYSLDNGISEGKKTTTFEEILEKDGYLVYTTVGWSMMPLLRQRKDIVKIRARKSPEERFKKYDVVLYKRGPKYVLHRIIKVRPDDYVIVGDHNIRKEYGITDARILGVMTQVIRDGKEITPDNLKYRLYVHLWCDFYPVRAMILWGKLQARRVVRKLRRILGRK